MDKLGRVVVPEGSAILADPRDIIRRSARKNGSQETAVSDVSCVTGWDTTLNSVGSGMAARANAQEEVSLRGRGPALSRLLSR